MMVQLMPDVLSFSLPLKVSIYLPPLRMLKSVVDRMKNISNYLVSVLVHDGWLILCI